MIAAATSRPPLSVGTPRRWGVFLLGLLCLIPGIGLMIAARLGVGSWQALETGLMARTGASFGVVALVESVVVLGLAWAWLRQPPWIATAVLAVAGIGINGVLAVLAVPTGIAERLLFFTLGTGLVAVGVAFYLAAELGASAQDSLFVGIYTRYGIRPGRVRFVLDAALVGAGAMLGGQVGAGTVAATLLIPLLIEPALLIGHRLAATEPPQALRGRGRRGLKIAWRL